MRNLESDERAVTELGRTLMSGDLCSVNAFPDATTLSLMVTECISQAAEEKCLALTDEEATSTFFYPLIVKHWV